MLNLDQNTGTRVLWTSGEQIAEKDGILMELLRCQPYEGSKLQNGRR